MSERAAGTLRERLIVWLWVWFPLGASLRLLISWLANLRYAVGVMAVVRNEAGEILLLNHNYRRGAYTWGMPGGWVKGRESLERALVRELREETGFALAVDRLVAVQSGYALPRITVIYLAHITGGTFRPSAEVASHGYFAPDALPPILPGERETIRLALGLS